MLVTQPHFYVKFEAFMANKCAKSSQAFSHVNLISSVSIIRVNVVNDHHSLQKHAMLPLINHAKTTCDTECFSNKTWHLRKTFKQNWYNGTAFNRAMNKKREKKTEKPRPIGLDSLPFQQSTSYKIGRLLRKFNIKSIHTPAKKKKILTC
jgi:hypothetical protein